jgi:hypothetical protein
MKWMVTLFFVFSTFVNQLEAKQIHVFLGADTITSLKKPMKQDLKHIKEELSSIARATGLPMTISEYKGQDLTFQNTIDWIDKTETHSDDIIIFYYTGHGVRVKHMKTPWPCFYFPALEEIVDSNVFINHLNSKSSQFCIVLADCCNVLISPLRSLDIYDSGKLPRRKLPDSGKKVYQQLFADTKGVIIASGATPGRRSWCTEKGSVFTTAFIMSLRNEIKKPVPNWSHVFRKTCALCRQSQSTQEPIFRVEVK